MQKNLGNDIRKSCVFWNSCAIVNPR